MTAECLRDTREVGRRAMSVVDATCVPALTVLPLNFLHALQIDQGFLADTPRCTGFPPPKKKIVKIKNLA